jgi:hypothetical protein
MSLRIQVDGVGLVEVDPSFQELSPQEQESLIGEIKQSVSGGRMASDAVAPAPASTPINASRSNFDLGAAIPDTQPEAVQSAAPQQAGQNPLAGTPFDYQRGSQVLEQFAADFMDKENIVTGAKYGDKAVIEEDWINARNQIYAPELERLGINPAKAQIAANQVVRGKARNMLEALGIPEPQNNPQVNLSPEQVEEARGLQDFIQNNINLANDTEDPRQKRQYQRMASEASQKLQKMSGDPEPNPYEKYENIRGVMEELGRKKERGGLGTVEYDGVRYPVSGAAELEADLASEQADLLDRLATDTKARESIRVRPQNAVVYETDSKGNPRKGTDGRFVINPKATATKWEELQNSARPGEITEREDGTIGPFMGAKEKRKGGDGYWTPDAIEPALAGAGVVAEGVATGASRLIPRVVSAAGDAVSAFDELTGGRQTRNVISKIPTALRGGSPSVMLAQQGLRYLSEIGLKAQEAEKKKKLAGQ